MVHEISPRAAAGEFTLKRLITVGARRGHERVFCPRPKICQMLAGATQAFEDLQKICGILLLRSATRFPTASEPRFAHLILAGGDLRPCLALSSPSTHKDVSLGGSINPWCFLCVGAAECDSSILNSFILTLLHCY